MDSSGRLPRSALRGRSPRVGLGSDSARQDSPWGCAYSEAVPLLPVRLRPWRCRAGASTLRSVLLCGALLAGLLVALVLSLARSTPAVESARPDPRDAVNSARAAAVAPGPGRVEQVELVGSAAWDLADVDVAPGVRLAGDGRLEGFVVERGSGAPVADVRLDLLPITPSATDFLGRILRLARTSERMDERARPVAVTHSGADGRFAFVGVRRGTYFLDARGTRHVPDNLVQARVAPSGDGGPLTCYVRPGGRVLGRVLRSDGRPAGGADVSLFHGPGVIVQAFREGELRQLDARCDREGRFVFAGVTPGEGYELHAVGDGFCVTHLPLPAIVAGQDLEVELTGRAALTLAGRVLASATTDADEGAELRPLAGAEVAVVPQGLRDLQFVESIFEDTLGVTDDEGRYVLFNVPPGEFELVARAPGFVAGASPRLTFPAGAGRVRAPDLVLAGGPRLTGRVVDSAGQPLSGVQVRWFLASMPNPLSFEFSFASLLQQAVGSFRFPTTDADGRFAAGPFPGEPPWDVYFGRAGYAYHRERWDPAETDELEVVLHAGGALEGIVMDAKRARPIERFSVAGLDQIGRPFDEPSSFNPFSGALLFEEESGRFRIEGLRAGACTPTVAAPGFHTLPLAPLEIREGETTRGVIVRLVPGGSVRGRVIDSQGDPVPGAQVAPLPEGDWSIQRTFARVNEHLTAGAYTETIPEAVTNAAMSFATRMGFLGEGATNTAANGEFELLGIEPGSFALLARRRGHALAKSPLMTLVEGGELEGIELVLTRGATLHGRVTDRFERPIAGAYVLASSPSEYSGDRSAEAAVYQGISAEDGTYEIPNMAGGGYFVAVTRGDQALTPMSLFGTLQFDLVNVPPGELTRYDPIDRSLGGCRVFGTVASAGEPVRTGGIVALTFESENVLGLDVKAARVQDDGSYAFPGLAPGGYEFLYQAGGNDVRLAVDVPDLPEARIDLALPGGGVAGRVLDDASGEPVEHCTVTLRRDAALRTDTFLALFIYNRGQDERVSTGADGSFAFHGYEAGRYTLCAEPEYAADTRQSVTIEPDRTTSEVEIRIASPRRLEGRLIDAEGRAVEGGEPVLYGAGGAVPLVFAERSGPDGTFVFEAVAPGSYDLVATAEGSAEGRLEGLNLESDDWTVELALPTGAALTVIVVAPSGRPVPGAVAQLFTPAGRPVNGGASNSSADVVSWFSGNSGSDADGRLALGRFAPGTYELEVRRGASRVTVPGVTVSERPTEVTVELE